jgi:hypothetical protein
VELILQQLKTSTPIVNHIPYPNPFLVISALCASPKWGL